MTKTYLTASPHQTQKLGRGLAEFLLKNRPKNKAVVVGLEGDLGGGKTTFLQGLAKGLGIKGRVLSPTFIIIRRIENFYHIDCYRIQKPKEILSLGFRKLTNGPKNVVVVEWADRIRRVMPKNTIWVKFEFLDENKRKIVLELRNGR